MKILYSVGNRPGGDIQLRRFLEGTLDEVMVCGYHEFMNLRHFDICLDGIYNSKTGGNRKKMFERFGRAVPMMGEKEFEVVIGEVEEFNPDLVICDFEPVISNIAYLLGKELWYCSPVHLLDGIKWGRSEIRYGGLLERDRKLLSKLPPANRKYILSPFNLVGDFRIKNGYKWLFPYVRIGGGGVGGVCGINDMGRISELSAILNCVRPYDLVMYSWWKYKLSHLESYLFEEDEEGYIRALGGWYFCCGETNLIGDALVSGSRICLSPRLSDSEGLLNGMIVELLGIGDCLGEIELMEHFSVEAIEESYWDERKRYCLKDGEIKFLHEEIDEFRDSI